MPKKYSPKLKFQMVMEVLKSDKTVSQIARAYDVPPNIVRNGEETFTEKGPVSKNSNIVRIAEWIGRNKN